MSRHEIISSLLLGYSMLLNAENEYNLLISVQAIDSVRVGQIQIIVPQQMKRSSWLEVLIYSRGNYSTGSGDKFKIV